MENKQNIQDLIQKFYPHAKEKLGFEHPVRVIMRQDAENAKHSLGKTAYYDPAEKLIVLYITNRHPKDVLRSFSHELVHHAQNCRGELDDLSTDDHYAKDGKGREIEKEAYLQGNFNVRDWEDNIKFEGVNEMKLTKRQLKSIIENTIEAIVTEKSRDTDTPPREDVELDSGEGVESLKDYAQEMIDAIEGTKKEEEGDDEEESPSGESIEEGEDMNLKESKQQKKQVVTETPQKTQKAKETNKAWYDTSLYNKLMSKWTKKGDK